MGWHGEFPEGEPAAVLLLHGTFSRGRCLSSPDAEAGGEDCPELVDGDRFPYSRGEEFIISTCSDYSLIPREVFQSCKLPPFFFGLP